MKNLVPLLPATALALCSAALTDTAHAAAVNQVSYASLTGTALIDFEDVAGNTNYNGIFESGGADFAERFVGQTLTLSGNFDVLSGSPGSPLTLQTGATSQNLYMLAYGAGYGNVLTGLGPLGNPNADAIGEGSFAVLFDYDQKEFGFRLLGGNNGSATVNFFARGGSLISSITLGSITDAYYGFSRDGGIEDIAGISIHNIDLGGIGFDDLKHSRQGVDGTVPDGASTALLLAFSVAAIIGRRSRQRTA